MGYIRYRKGVSDLRHLRHPLAAAADETGTATGASIGSAYALRQPISSHTAATVRAIHAIPVLASYLEIFIPLKRPVAAWKFVVAKKVKRVCPRFTISRQIDGQKNMWRIGPRMDRGSLTGRSSMSLLGKLAEARAELDARHEDPWGKKVKEAVRGKDAISTAALLICFAHQQPRAQRAASPP